NLNDQRVNLGVVVWHPVDGFQCKFATTLGRVHAVNARADLDELEDSLKEIEGLLLTSPKEDCNALERLCCWYKDGIEVAKPYPARISSLSALSDKLYQMLVTPKAEGTKPIQNQFQDSFKKAMRTVVRQIAGAGLGIRELGKHAVN